MVKRVGGKRERGRGRDGGIEVGREGRGKKVWQSVGEPPS